MDEALTSQALEAMKRALFLLESPLNEPCIRDSQSVDFLRQTIAKVEAA